MTTLNGAAHHAPLRLTPKTAFDHECLIVGAMLYRTDCRGALAHVSIESFADPLHRAIAAACMAHIDNGEPVNPIDIAHDLRKAEIESEPAIVQRFNELDEMQVIANPWTVRGAVNRLNERTANAAMSRELERVKRDLDAEGITAIEAAEQIGAARAKHAPAQSVRLMTLADTLTTDPKDDAGELIRTGFAELDGILPDGALHVGEKIVIGGGPGSGKTALVLYIVVLLLITNPTLRVVWGMGEMSARQLRNRCLQLLSGLTLGVLRRQWDDLSPTQLEAKRKAIDTLKAIGGRMFIVDAPLSVKAIAEAVEANGAGVLVVDYLQLVKPDAEAENRRDGIDGIVRSLTALSQRTGVIGIWLSSMPKSAIGKVDVFSAFKESSEIAHAVDLAYLLRPSIDTDDPDANQTDVIDVRLQCLKARNGSPRSISLRFDRCSQQWGGYRP